MLISFHRDGVVEGHLQNFVFAFACGFLVLTVLPGMASAHPLEGFWQEIGERSEDLEITASDGNAHQWLGTGLSLDADWLAAGAPGVDGSGLNTGAVYLFQWHPASESWEERQVLWPEDSDWGASFGGALQLQQGNLLVSAEHGRVQNSSGLRVAAGLLYFYQWNPNGEIWEFQQKVKALDPAPGDRFGASIDVDQNRLLVGAPMQDQKGKDAGAAYLFTWNDEVELWEQHTKFLPSDLDAGDQFGIDVALHGDLCLIGAWLHDGATEDGGAAFVYQFDSGSDQWLFQKKLHSPILDPGSGFGYSLALDASRAFIGAFREDHDLEPWDCGAAHLYRRKGGEWDYEARFLPSNPGVEGNFGFSVALSSGMLAVGGWMLPGSQSGTGAVDLFRWDQGSASWSWWERWIASDGAPGDAFGKVCLEDGWSVVSASNRDAAKISQGSLFLFDNRNLFMQDLGNDWIQIELAGGEPHCWSWLTVSEIGPGKTWFPGRQAFVGLSFPNLVGDAKWADAQGRAAWLLRKTFKPDGHLLWLQVAQFQSRPSSMLTWSTP